MADGESQPDDELVEARQRNWIAEAIRSRQMPFVVWIVVAFLALIVPVFVHTFTQYSILETTGSKITFLASTAVLVLPIVLLFRDAPDNLAHGPSIKLPILSIGLLACVTIATVLVAGLPTGYLDKQNALHGPLLACIAAGVTAAYVPMIWNAKIIQNFYSKSDANRAVADQAGLGDADQRDAESVNALISTLVVAGIALLAAAAGRWGAKVNLQAYYGIGLAGFVLMVFALVIFSEPLSSLPVVKRISKLLGRLAILGRPFAWLYNLVDGLLVRIGATVAGMEHRHMWTRYLLLSAQLCAFCLMGWFLPAPWGLLPCSLGVLIAISVSRLWSWVEDDRALALLTNFRPRTPFRTRMREDYRDETLLGFIFVFVLIPIMMKQAHDSTLFGGAMFDVPEHRDGFWNWVGFFGIELAKAVPIVDWAEIYQIQANAGGELIAMKSESSRHAVFMARATVDLVLIASLLQAISISNRNRQQKQLFRAGAGPRNAFDPGLINRLDKFVEESELRKAINACLNPGHPTVDRSTTPNQAHDEIFNLRKLSDPHLIDFRRYNPDRLLEIYGESKDVNVRAFIAAISYERPDLTLKSRIQLLEEYAENGRNELDLYAVLQRILSDRAANPQQNAPDLEKLRSIMLHVRRRQGLKDFKRSVLELISEANAKDQAIEVLGDIAGRSDPDDFQYARVDAIKMIEKIGCENRNLVAHSTAVLKDILRRKPAASVVHAANRALANISSCS